ncbi:type VI secretion system-associated protein TagF [Sphingomonas sp. DT-51]|uniref:type VI secretion system-associated protein TagF n=1 Tax=Sphingomonas sp. DT-51 TaxID=3396165 RepID=UPI003F19D28B
MTGFLFGKLPAFGDFVTRGLSADARARWDDRCVASLVAARERLGDAFDRDYGTLPPCRFLLRTGGAGWQAGCVMPSVDRTGRAFPFVWGVAGTGTIDEAIGTAITERIADRSRETLAARVDLDALAATAARLASDEAGERRTIALAPFRLVRNAANGLEM